MPVSTSRERRPLARLFVATVLITLIAVSLPGCRRRHRPPQPGVPYASSTSSEKLATFIFKEEGKLYLMTVGVNVTRFHDKDAFIPLTVVLVNKANVPLEITRESFTLVDPVTGRRYGLASIDEVRRQGKQLYDRRLMDLEHLASKLEIFQQLRSNFFPFQEIVNDNLELHAFQYFIDNLYFPRPEGELLGKTFELHVNAKGLQGDLFVVFTVPEK